MVLLDMAISASPLLEVLKALKASDIDDPSA